MTCKHTSTGIERIGQGAVVQFVETDAGAKLFSAGFNDLGPADLRHVAALANDLATNADLRAKSSGEERV